MWTRIACLLGFATLASGAATLTPEAAKAWDRYLECQHEKLLSRAQTSAGFLWVDGSPDRLEKVSEGEPAVSQAVGNGMIKAPAALIHHWIGAAFLRGATGEEVLAVIRDYNHYQQYYRPGVHSSKTLSRNDTSDRFAVLLVSQNLMVKTSVETEYEATFTKAGDKRWYAETHSTRIKEVDGSSGPYVWRLASQTRLEERDGGVYIEVEVMALSREIPGSLKFLVDPIVRRLAKSSLTESLKQTSAAVESVGQSALVSLTNGSKTVSR